MHDPLAEEPEGSSYKKISNISPMSKSTNILAKMPRQEGFVDPNQPIFSVRSSSVNLTENLNNVLSPRPSPANITNIGNTPHQHYRLTPPRFQNGDSMCEIEKLLT